MNVLMHRTIQNGALSIFEYIFHNYQQQFPGNLKIWIQYYKKDEIRKFLLNFPGKIIIDWAL